MGRCEKLMEKAENNPAGMTYKELAKLAECAGFVHARSTGSHRVFKHEKGKTVTLTQKKGTLPRHYADTLLGLVEQLEEEE